MIDYTRKYTILYKNYTAELSSIKKKYCIRITIWKVSNAKKKYKGSRIITQIGQYLEEDRLKRNVSLSYLRKYVKIPEEEIVLLEKDTAEVSAVSFFNM